ncbi:hypothetical protein [Dongia rigui]|uniref:PepSY domain-containing protein n=1 Tax=Dongia rigui TaxID=940149 RepID=A0ABU5DW34_9PROT|nr:hypothetical protein [Dongia rigui]MDY0871517.1 hypothetical protein [Dongia rigui]
MMRKRHLVISTWVLVAGLSGSAAAIGGGHVDAANILLSNARDTATVPQPVSPDEAKLWILNAGYDQVSGLESVTPGIYQGTAVSDGATYDVTVDSVGNVLGIKE